MAAEKLRNSTPLDELITEAGAAWRCLDAAIEWTATARAQRDKDEALATQSRQAVHTAETVEGDLRLQAAMSLARVRDVCSPGTWGEEWFKAHFEGRGFRDAEAH